MDGINLKARREALGLTQIQLSKYVGVHLQTIKEYEKYGASELCEKVIKILEKIKEDYISEIRITIENGHQMITDDVARLPYYTSKSGVMKTKIEGFVLYNSFINRCHQEVATQIENYPVEFFEAY